MQTNDKRQKVTSKKSTMEHWKYSDDYNQTFPNKSNFGI